MGTHAQFNSISSASLAGVSLAAVGMRRYHVRSEIGVIIDPADDDVFGKGYLTGKGRVSGDIACDAANHGLDAGDTGAGGFTEKQGATTKAVVISNQVITAVDRTAVDRGGKGVTTATFEAYSSDGTTSPVAFPA